MKPRDRHVGKTAAARQHYLRYIRDLDYEPTLDETLVFADSDRRTKDLTERDSSQRRKLPFSRQIREHVKDHWIEWAIAILGIILVYLMVDSRIDIASLSIRFDNLKERIISVEQDLRKNIEINHGQDMQIQKNQIKIESLFSKEEPSKPQQAPSLPSQSK